MYETRFSSMTAFLSLLNLANVPGPVPAMAADLPSCEVHLLVYARDDEFRKTITTGKAAFVSVCKTGMNRKSVARPATWAAKRELRCL